MIMAAFLSMITLIRFSFTFASIYTNVTPLKLGVEITDINLQDHLNNSALFDQIREDIHKYRLMLFRNQGVVPADSLIKMFERFGEIYHEPYTTRTTLTHNHPKSPAPYVFCNWLQLSWKITIFSAIMRISNDVTEGFKGLGTTGWHIDGAYKPIPFSHLIFNVVKAPVVGDTKCETGK